MANSNFHLANLIGLYSGRQVRAEVNEALMALAAFMKVAGIDIDKGLEAFQAEVSRLDNAIDTDVALIDQLDKQKEEAKDHLSKVTAASEQMHSANALIRNVAAVNVKLDV